ncbi:cytochrome P450 [Nonomuraea sp. NPDC050556]|uniref:cytochrome P450 n=1 Tax=Nonomuraea sp. NPDC050556 TaxID=3364369 RepID=UPI003787A94C
MTLPRERQRPFDPPDELKTLPALGRMTYPDGHNGWLVTGYAAARAILAHPGFSNLPQHEHQPIAQRGKLVKALGERDIPRPKGMFLRMDAPDHTRFRRLLTGQFTVRRMKDLEPRIAEIVSSCLDALAASKPADLVSAFALPVPSLVICELLGVPYEDRGRFQADARVLLNLESEPEALVTAFGAMFGYFAELVARKRADPGDDLLSGLVLGGELEDEELVGVAALLLIAGHETTANMLGLGTFALLTNPAQLALMRDDPSVVDNAVEELLRYLTIIHLGPVRTALEDVMIDGITISAGESVTFSLPAANRDPSRFSAPDELDFTRSASGHLTFGHGIHQCLGQQLARIEMRIGYPALLRRFPGLRLAVPASEVPMRSEMTIYGVHRLPVTW